MPERRAVVGREEEMGVRDLTQDLTESEKIQGVFLVKGPLSWPNLKWTS